VCGYGCRGVSSTSPSASIPKVSERTTSSARPGRTLHSGAPSLAARRSTSVLMRPATLDWRTACRSPGHTDMVMLGHEKRSEQARNPRCRKSVSALRRPTRAGLRWVRSVIERFSPHNAGKASARCGTGLSLVILRAKLAKAGTRQVRGAERRAPPHILVGS